MTAPERAVVIAAKEFAAVCADCEHLRVTEPYPHLKWSDAWKRHSVALVKLMDAARALESRPTEPPEMRP